jgi:hypothetical protein
MTSKLTMARIYICLQPSVQAQRRRRRQMGLFRSFEDISNSQRNLKTHCNFHSAVHMYTACIDIKILVLNVSCAHRRNRTGVSPQLSTKSTSLQSTPSYFLNPADDAETNGRHPQSHKWYFHGVSTRKRRRKSRRFCVYSSPPRHRHRG